MYRDASSNDESMPQSVQQGVDKAREQFEAALRAGQRPHVENYLAIAPEVDRVRLLRELVALEVMWRVNADEKPTLSEYVLRFPTHPEAIQAAFNLGLR